MRLLLNPSKKWCYIAIKKNCSMTFSTFLQQNGWTDVSMRDAEELNCRYFSHIQNPFERYYKGIAEILYKQPDAQVHLMQNGLIPTMFLDDHVLPISVLTNDISRFIHFIPMDYYKYSCNELTNDFFAENNIDLKIRNGDVKHVSSTKKKPFQQKVRKQLEIGYNSYLRVLYATDLKLHNAAIKRISSPPLELFVEPKTLMDNVRIFFANYFINSSR